jgi:hypothetical protein
LPKECPDCAIMLANKIGMQDGWAVNNQTDSQFQP